MKVAPKDTILKNALFGLVLALLLLPWLEQNEHIFEPKPLGGAQPSSENVKFSLAYWRTAKFQEGQEKYISEHFGLRPFMVRFYNEVFDRLFGEYQANGVIVGKHGYLFEEGYLLAASGQDYIGRDSINELVQTLALVQRDLKQSGKELLVCIAPGKGSFFPDKMPDAYRYNGSAGRNYPNFIRELVAEKIPLFDVQDWFLKMKATAPYPLYPKTGIHWSSYGEYLVADSLIKQVSALSQKTLPALKLLGIEQDTKPRDRDDDIELGMNLLRDIPDLKMAYPKFEIKPLPAGRKAPKVLVIGDSFYYGMYNWGMMQHVFEGGEFWYYNHERLVPGKATTYLKDVKDYKASVKEFDVVILLLTEANLPRFGFGMMPTYLKD
jgi:SGNH hydrolase-like domain, acetyltransferase AlgX